MPSMSMYQASVPLFKQTLGALAVMVDKAAAHCETKKIDPNAILAFRLFPDMFAFTRQIQVTCDSAKGAVARLAGVEIPKHDDTEASFAELRARIEKTLAFIDSVPAASIDGSEDRPITIKLRSGTLEFTGMRYLVHFALPNFYFHATTTYNILRHNGVEVGKGDFLGKY
jgi:uncharacterized protein